MNPPDSHGRKRPGPAPPSSIRGMAREVVQALLPPQLLVLRGPGRRPCVALTFDDGPDPYTPRFLDVLDRLHARATFFVVGSAVERYPQYLAEYRRRGHQVAYHGYIHDRFAKMSSSAVWDELVRGPGILRSGDGSGMGEHPDIWGRPLIRPPYGSIDFRSLCLCHAAGYLPVLWSLDTQDWQLHQPDELVRYTLDQPMRSGEILLLHEGQPWTLEALPALIGALRDRGFDLVTVGELLAG